jgi:adenosylcobinamide-phosphate synthase
MATRRPVVSRPVTGSSLRFPARVAVVWLALIADRLLGEPPARLHPVALFGRAMTQLEKRTWADGRRRGALYALVGAGGATALGAVAGGRHPRQGAVVLALATYVAVAATSLNEAAGEVARALHEDDLPAARLLLRNLVGRETAFLDEAEVVRATVESLAENTVDAVTAPLLWALWAGAPGVLGYRAVNTLDAMVGHRSPRYERFGWAAARADDAANWVPARLTAVAVAAVRPSRAAAVFRAVRGQAPAHPSPNAGVVEGAFAAAMGVRLGGVNDYAGRIEHRPCLGEGPAPDRRHIAEACRLSRQATVALCVAATVPALIAGSR